ncbi:hypothetical protein SLEP1_g41358 [Rubroshorea leprosula]|uniref:Uncharacterized protein n=1 Tax=Rubroshorea leprosula TaxID=152421 RepID=A0AAV5L6C9_9ROSI|nr:hypothetical protein SLEP1_g41358 [Rubroshorea leprosula]
MGELVDEVWVWKEKEKWENKGTAIDANQGNRSEDYRKESRDFWAGLASEDELLQVRSEEKLKRKLKKSRGARSKKVRGRKEMTVARCKRSNPDRANGGVSRIEQEEELSLRDNTISTGGIINCNQRFMVRLWEEEASELSAVGKKLGLVRRCNEGEISKRLDETETRDKNCSSKTKTES